MSEYSSEAVLDFLDYGASKGLFNKSTAGAKKIAVERVFEIADPSEAADVRTVDLSSLMTRFINVSGSGFKPESLASYQSRAKSAIEDFVSWKQNPMGFRTSRRGTPKKAKPSQAQSASKVLDRPIQATNVEAPKVSTLSLPIPIRADLTVYVNGVPFDLTKAEATKIANVVLAMAVEM